MIDPVYERSGIRVYHGDCRELVPSLGEQFAAVVTDPPYGLSFMGRDWDHAVPGVAFWEAFRDAMLPGAHLLAFGGSRTYHRIAVAIEDAGFEIRDTLQWLYGSGFPKSLDVSKAIDKLNGRKFEDRYALGRHIRERREAAGMSRAAVNGWFGYRDGCEHWERQDPSGARVPTLADWRILHDRLGLSDEFLPLVERVEAEREVTGKGTSGKTAIWSEGGMGDFDITAPATDAAREWEGWGTALKPSVEPVIVSRKPYTEEQERGIIVANLVRLEAQLWSLLPASIAVESFGLIPAEHDAACASAQWSAADKHNTLDGLCDPTDTSQFVSVMATCLSTVQSWSDILVALWTDTNTSTTETASGPTIDLKTLRCLLSATTPRIIIQAATEAPGSMLSAVPAARYFHAVEKSMSATLELSALAGATSPGHIGSPDAGGLTPNVEPIILARKPLSGTVAANVLEHGTGALNIDACRIGTEPAYVNRPRGPKSPLINQLDGQGTTSTGGAGRWPSNVILDETAAAQLDQMSGERPSRPGKNKSGAMTPGFSGGWGAGNNNSHYPDSDHLGASRFFPVLPIDDPDTLRFTYQAKASRRERNAGLDGLPEVDAPQRYGLTAGGNTPQQTPHLHRAQSNSHPTVKPLALMRWLLTLVTPPGGTVLDPFAGSGTTGVAAAQLGIPCVLIEHEAEYLPIIIGRIDHALDARAGAELPLFAGVAD